MKIKQIISSILLYSIIFISSIFGIEISNTIDGAIKKSESNNNRILVIFTIDNCVYCDALKSYLIKQQDIDQKYNICIIDSVEDKDISKLYGIKSWPTSVVLANKPDRQEISRMIGFSTAKYANWIEKNTQNQKK